MPQVCQHCGAALALGAIACFRCGRMVERDEAESGPSLVVAGTQLGTVAKLQLLEDQWRLVAPIGRGQTGEVWRAQDVTLDRPVAVKLMHEELAADPAQVARFEREARVLAGLEHPNLLPVLGIGRLGARPFLVTRLLEGKTLAEVMHARGGRLPPSEAARILIPICDALAALHETNVVHRDVKPSNVFVGDDRRVTLMDLGSALESGSELTRFGEVVGTHGYLSPEQKLGRRTLDGKTDVYAVGCLLGEVLTGALDGDLSAIPLRLAELVRFATQVEPAERPTITELRAQLQPYVIAEEATAPMGAPLKSEAPTQGVVFTPTTGSPEYPHLQALPEPREAEKETREAPAPRRSGPKLQLVRPPEVESGPAVPLAIATASTAVQLPAVASSSTVVLPKSAAVAAPKPKLSKQAQAALGVGAFVLCIAFGVGLIQPEPAPPPPVRIDHPSVPVAIAKDDKGITIQMVEPPKADHIVYDPHLDERKAGLYEGSGSARPLAKKPNRGPVLPHVLRVSTVVGDFMVPAYLWTKREHAKDWELRGRTPFELELKPGVTELRIQYEDDPPVFVRYPLELRDYKKLKEGFHLIIPLRNTQLVDDEDSKVSLGELNAGRVGAAESGKPMTKQRARGSK